MECKIAPVGGPWDGAEYTFDIKIPNEYPHQPPTCSLREKIYHPNITLEGKVCLNILRRDWKPVQELNSVIFGLNSLFHAPVADDPLNKEAAAHLRDRKSDYLATVKKTLRGGNIRLANSVESFPNVLKRAKK